MLSKSRIKLINSLKQKKYRQQHQLFIAEGIKSINELIHSDFILRELYTITNEFAVSDDLVTIITPKELARISNLKTPNTALALFEIPDPKPIMSSGIVVALDDIRDPGNLGTIIRLCDWFGIKDLVCSTDTVDCFNPKVIQATMGSIARINITYLELDDFVSNSDLPKIGTFMDGDSIYNTALIKDAILVFGNESNGISEVLEKNMDFRLAIPSYGSNNKAESLNVSIAAAICLAEFRRKATGK